MSNYIRKYKNPKGNIIEAYFIDNRGHAVTPYHPGGSKEYAKDYYFVRLDKDMSMTEFEQYVKDNKLEW